MPVEKQQRAQRLILGRSADVLPYGQMRQKPVDLHLAYSGRVAFSMKENEPFDPGQVGLFRSATVVSRSEDVSHSQKELLLMRK